MTATATSPAPSPQPLAVSRELAPFKIHPITFEETAERLREIAAESMQLTVKDLADTPGIDACHTQRMQLVKLRGNIERRRKALKALALEYGRNVDIAAKELSAIIAPAERHLEDQESIVSRERERLAREAEEQRHAMIRERLRLLQECGRAYMACDLAELSEDDYDALLATEQKAKRERDEQAAAEEAERQRIDAERQAEAERLAREKIAFEAERQASETRVKRMQARIVMLAQCEFTHGLDHDQLADLPAEEWEQLLETARRRKAEIDRAAARQRSIELEQAKAESAERAKREAEEQRQREEAEAKARAAAEAAEQKRVEAARPDAEKLLSVATAVRSIVVPDVSKASKAVAESIRFRLGQWATEIESEANSLTTKKTPAA